MLWPQIPRFFHVLFPDIIWKKNTNEKIVYLTFDDGPHPEITTWVLDLLNQHQAVATFFCLGKNLKAYPSIAENILKQNSVIGNHTYTHVKAGKVSTNEYITEIEQTSKLIQNKLFRPPYGKLTIDLWWKIRKKYTIVLWHLMAYDFDSNVNITSMLSTLKKETEPGSIVVFHDNEKSFKQLKKLLPPYLEWLKQNQFKFEVLH